MIQLTVTPEYHGMRLLQYLRDVLPHVRPVKFIKRAIENKRCLINNAIESFSTHVVKKGDRISLNLKQIEKPKSMDVIYEDKELLVYNKVPGIVCSPKDLGVKALVHRLDKETSGVLLIAKTPTMQSHLEDLFRKRKVKKEYLALVEGIVQKEGGRLDNYLHKRSFYQGTTIYAVNMTGKGKRAITEWKKLKTNEKTTLIRCRPITGRTHQIRVQLSTMGHPVVGDTLYGSNTSSRYLLHAHKIEFDNHTFTVPCDFSS